MTEAEYISELRSRWPHELTDDVSLETLALADDAVRVSPSSAKLWVIRGDLIQLGPESDSHNLDDALASYQHALDIDPSFAEAWEEIGHYYDAVLDDEKTAERCFREAAKLRRSSVE